MNAFLYDPIGGEIETNGRERGCHYKGGSSSSSSSSSTSTTNNFDERIGAGDDAIIAQDEAAIAGGDILSASGEGANITVERIDAELIDSALSFGKDLLVETLQENTDFAEQTAADGQKAIQENREFLGETLDKFSENKQTESESTKEQIFLVVGAGIVLTGIYFITKAAKK
jgi:hypothetical protein